MDSDDHVGVSTWSIPTPRGWYQLGTCLRGTQEVGRSRSWTHGVMALEGADNRESRGVRFTCSTCFRTSASVSSVISACGGGREKGEGRREVRTARTAPCVGDVAEIVEHKSSGNHDQRWSKFQRNAWHNEAFVARTVTPALSGKTVERWVDPPG